MHVRVVDLFISTGQSTIVEDCAGASPLSPAKARTVATGRTDRHMPESSAALTQPFTSADGARMLVNAYCIRNLVAAASFVLRTSRPTWLAVDRALISEATESCKKSAIGAAAAWCDKHMEQKHQIYSCFGFAVMSEPTHLFRKIDSVCVCLPEHGLFCRGISHATNIALRLHP